MVNIQNVQEFSCQVLNRDIWNNHAVKTIIETHFIFWQVYQDSEEGRKYRQFYKVLDWPYVAILDPQTGENMVIWNKLDAVSFCDKVSSFLSEHPSPNGTSPSPVKCKERSSSIIDHSEDSQMEAAIKMSLVQNVSPNKDIHIKSHDSDSQSECSDLETFTDSDTEVTNSPVKTKKQTSCSRSQPSSTVTKSSLKHKPTTEKETINTSKDTNSEINHLNGEDGGKKETWREYLGNESDESSSLVLRFPDNHKEQLTMPATSQLMALVQYVIHKGYSNEKYELVTNFPRRRLSLLNYDITLKEAGLFPQEAVFIQER
ncbi:unnamed protein product [Owenia fusiformis]|uniref:UBX domain-containing protein n=1 Tax=Owenia fusiformis TaxID=6347 RepID=A0A8S4NKQ1_OWEFU|nr:unnamed protein product [Owenia fusiformis]